MLATSDLDVLAAESAGAGSTPLEPDDETVSGMEMIGGFDDDLAAEATPSSATARDSSVRGPAHQHPLVPQLLDRFATRSAERPVEDFFTAFDEQTVEKSRDLRGPSPTGPSPPSQLEHRPHGANYPRAPGPTAKASPGKTW
ncbi:hypothetical protein ACFV16_25315 [Streptomyces massasporeus]|uniref:hypothetical protein n=1 Tax=Streptomyces massasporeus TaxID=67324 RepID=UPI0036C03BF8